MAELPRGTVTFLFTDIEGSTGILQKLGAAYAQALTEHRRTLRAAFAAHRGIEVDTQGDAFFVAFARAEDAVAAAHDAQRALAGGPVRVRMGIHTGEPVVTEEGYVGIDVHLGARICAAGHGGQVLVSVQTRRCLDPTIEVLDLGEHRLKDLGSPQWLFQLLASDLDDRFPPLRSLNNTNLPAQATSLVGRSRELAELRALLGRDDVRLVTLTGPGGTGKTRLALRFAADSVERFRNGVFLVSLAALRDGELLLSTVMQTLGAKQAGTEGSAETLARHLAGKSLLLVLDNFEHLLVAAPSVGGLVASAEQLKVVVTSRERLHLAGEHVYPVPPLPEAEAVSLFVERASASDSSFRLNGDRPTVAAICRRLDGLPLAIELAAARTRMFRPEALLARLDRTMSLLTGGARDLPERQRTLRATIGWSHELLDKNEQEVFACLSAFDGSWDPRAADSVCGASVDVLASLYDKSLLRREDGPVGEPRFTMLETIREFARERLEARGVLEVAKRRHARHYAALSREKAEGRGRARGLTPSPPPRTSYVEWLDWLELERHNLASALGWLSEHGDVHAAVELVFDVWRLWVTRGPLPEGRLWTEKVLALPSVSGEPEFGWLLGLSSDFPRFQGDFPRARALLEGAVAQLRASGDAPRLATCLAALGSMLANQGDYEPARALLEESLELSRELNEEARISHAINGLTLLAFRQGDFRRMADFAEEECAMNRAAGNEATLAGGLHNLAEARRHLGDLAAASSCYAESLSLSEKLSEIVGLAECLDGLGDVAAALAQMQRAVQLWAAAHELLDQMGQRPWDAPGAAAGVARAKSALGPAAFEEAWEVGRHMRRADAIALASDVAAVAVRSRPQPSDP